ncbi:MAG: hypothetical protein ACRC4W_08815, partial [Treponemataceae bacterium]
TKTGGYYDPMDNKIHLNINKPRKESSKLGFSKNMITFFHEAGHWLDFNALGNRKYLSDLIPN